MKGTVFFRPSKSSKVDSKKRRGAWTYAFSVTTASGRRRQITKGGFATRRACEAALAEAMVEQGRGTGTRVEPSKRALADFLQDWLESRTGLKPTTRANYQRAITNWIAPLIGDVRLCDLTAAEITRMYRVLRETGSPRGQSKTAPLSERSVHKAHVVMSAALSYAAETGQVRVNPTTLIPKRDRPKQNGHDRREMRTWTAEEARTFLVKTSSDRYAPIYDLALNTGLRRGELAGLRWVDIDLEAGALSVRRSRTSVDWKVHEGTPKSTKARVVDLDADTVAMLRRWRAAQLEERLAWGEAWTDAGYVFTREDGTAIHPETISWHLERLLRRVDIPHIRLHDLRHTHATLGLAAGVPLKVMSERLGHATTQITADLYQHVIPGMGAEAAAKIGSLLRRAQ